MFDPGYRVGLKLVNAGLPYSKRPFLSALWRAAPKQRQLNPESPIAGSGPPYGSIPQYNALFGLEWFVYRRIRGAFLRCIEKSTRFSKRRIDFLLSKTALSLKWCSKWCIIPHKKWDFPTEVRITSSQSDYSNFVLVNSLS